MERINRKYIGLFNSGEIHCVQARNQTAAKRKFNNLLIIKKRKNEVAPYVKFKKFLDAKSYGELKAWH